MKTGMLHKPSRKGSMFIQTNRTVAIRFEDLVLDPETTLQNLFRRLSLKSAGSRIQRITAAIECDNHRFAYHRTSPNPHQSVFRWKTDLERDVANTFSFLLADELTAFGYEVDSQPTRPSESLLRRHVRYAG
jgi:hypothetical protein